MKEAVEGSWQMQNLNLLLKEFDSDPKNREAFEAWKGEKRNEKVCHPVPQPD